MKDSLILVARLINFMKKSIIPKIYEIRRKDSQ